jgi:hypothetical protein
VVSGIAANARDLEAELQWFVAVADGRLQSYFETTEPAQHFQFRSLPPPRLPGTGSGYAQLVSELGLIAEERLVLLLALLPHIRPQLLDILFSKNAATGRGHTEFGGLQGQSHSGFLPTIETALFLLAGDNLEERFAAMQLLDAGAILFAAGVVQASTVNPIEPWNSAALHMRKEIVDQLTSGLDYRPGFTPDFPARALVTPLDWQHLVLPAGVLEQLEEIRTWINHSRQLLDDWEMRGKLAPGFTSLFYGPPGTGKTLSASLLAKYCGRKLYKIDLSLMVSKFIGETEKNLARIFNAAENREWMLFFDEADALFGKRTRVDDSHDRYANQEVSYLLQRIEEFNGVVILATNFKSNIDEAFIRRFQSIIQFPLPAANERLRIWRNAFPDKVRLEPQLKLEAVAEKYEVAGGTIMNAVRFSSLRALNRGDATIMREDIEEGLRREFSKEGRRL